MPSMLRFSASSGIKWRQTSIISPRQGNRGLSSMRDRGRGESGRRNFDELQECLEAVHDAERICSIELRACAQ